VEDGSRNGRRKRRGEMRKPMELGNEQGWHGKWKGLLEPSVVILAARMTWWREESSRASGRKRERDFIIVFGIKSKDENVLSQVIRSSRSLRAITEYRQKEQVQKENCMKKRFKH